MFLYPSSFRLQPLIYHRGLMQLLSGSACHHQLSPEFGFNRRSVSAEGQSRPFVGSTVSSWKCRWEASTVLTEGENKLLYSSNGYF